MLRLCEEITPPRTHTKIAEAATFARRLGHHGHTPCGLDGTPTQSPAARWDSGGMAGGFEMFFDDMEISFAFSLCERTVLFFQWREGGREGKVPRNKGAMRDTIRSPSVRIFPSRESSKNPCWELQLHFQKRRTLSSYPKLSYVRINQESP